MMNPIGKTSHAQLIRTHGGDDEAAQINDGLVEVFNVAYGPRGTPGDASRHGQAAGFPVVD